MNIRKRRKKANKRVERYVRRRGMAIEPYGYVSNVEANLAFIWDYFTRKARR